MILSFSFENILSFKDLQTLSLRASAKKERLFEDSENYVQSGKDLKILSSVAVYGANASGKSNFIKALFEFKMLVMHGNQNLENINFRIPKFQLAAESLKGNSVFEIECFWKGRVFRYGFSLNERCIEEEWLYVKEKREVEVFYRAGQVFNIATKQLVLSELVSKSMVHSKAFLITIGAQFNDPICVDFIEWLQQISIISSVEERSYKDLTLTRMKESKAFSKQVLDLLKLADVGIEDLMVSTYTSKGNAFNGDYSSAYAMEPTFGDELISKRYVVDEQGKPRLKEFRFGVFESAGTQKLANIAGPILDALHKGGVFVVDELDRSIHPELMERLVLLFHNHTMNKQHAQLIFTSHNTNLLDAKIFRRDQIVFVEKDAFGASKLYSLAEFKKDGKATRNDENIEKNYLKGKYGALPMLGDFDNRLNR